MVVSFRAYPVRGESHNDTLTERLEKGHSNQGRSQDFSKGGAEVMEAKALKRKNCL